VTDLVTVENNCPDEAVATAIAEAVVGRRLAACASIHAAVDSLYHWRGGIERAREVPLTLKTRAALLPTLAEVARALHPYETPSILATAVSSATDDYHAWLLAETEGAA
jgi:periplasmic divalent cation tolerance protein